MSAPQPPAHQPFAAGQPAPDGSGRFGKTPVGAFLTTAIVAIAGVVTYVLTASANVTAMCDDDRMGPADLCETRTNGIVTDTRTYTEVLAAAQRANTIWQWIGIILVVIGVVFAVLVYVRWRQDVALKSQLRDDHGHPLSAHSKTASTSFFGIAAGAALIGLAGWLLLNGLSKDEWPFYLGTAVAGAVGLLLLYAAVPTNGQLVQTFDQGVRVVSRGTVSDVPWQGLDYQIIPGKGMANHSISAPGLKAVPLGTLSDHEKLEQAVQQHTVQAKYRPALEAIQRGETVAFGKVSVSREGIATGSKTLPWHQYGGVVLSQGQVTIAKSPKGAFLSTSLASFQNYSLFVHVVDAIVKQQPRAAPQA